MQSNTAFSLTQSGQPFILPNTVETSSNLTVAYALANLTSATITCEGISNATGATFLDSYSGGSVTGRSISLGSVGYDSFRFTATFAGTQQSSVAVNVQSVGNGATFSADLDIANIATVS